MLGCQEANNFFSKNPAVPSSSWTAGMQVILYIKCLFGDGNGEWTMEDWVVSRGLRLTDCFVWLTKQRRNIYAVA